MPLQLNEFLNRQNDLRDREHDTSAYAAWGPG